ncbi:MAG: HAMP domain-containing sensor histidine kinase [Solirubrobacteraceae bacterium]|nr:HAMP domain-containing sensor histidine kinase [Solirubrobacteraceae bacterium]
MMSLRARLIVGVVALTFVGLFVAGAATYAEQRSFLFDRVDQQAEAALPIVTDALAARGSLAGDGLPGGPDRSGGRGGPPGGGPDGGPGRGRGPDRALSTALYGEARDRTGAVLGRVTPRLPAGETAPAPPRLPAQLQAGRRLTADSDGGPRYRVVTRSSGDGLVLAALPLTEVDATLSRLLLIEALVFGAVLLALGLGAWWIVRIGLRPLDAIGATAGAIAAGDLARRVEPAEPRTEVGRLGLSLNAMLARLEEAFAERRASEERLRRFLADASHELRTPLASIRGYAELFRLGAAARPEDVSKAMVRIEDESARMGVLVEDLLALARLDEVREQVRAPVDLRRLAADAVDDARAVAPDRKITLDGSDAAVVDGDADQLRQVLANLMRNALVHTPVGTPIEVSLATRDGDATLAVRDHGPGLPTEDPSELFHRFWRGDGPARPHGRGRAGAGLGLAIVAGVVAAHGGRATAADAEGGGAHFEIVLPLRRP